MLSQQIIVDLLAQRTRLQAKIDQDEKDLRDLDEAARQAYANLHRHMEQHNLLTRYLRSEGALPEDTVTESAAVDVAA